MQERSIKHGGGVEREGEGSERAMGFAAEKIFSHYSSYGSPSFLLSLPLGLSTTKFRSCLTAEKEQ